MIKVINKKVEKEVVSLPLISFKTTCSALRELYIITPILKGKRFDYAILYIDPSRISCGVYQLHNIYRLEFIIRNSLKYRDEDEVFTMLEQCLISCISIIKKEKDAAFLIASNSNNYPLTNKILKSIAIKTTNYKVNPGSGNKICVFVF